MQRNFKYGLSKFETVEMYSNYLYALQAVVYSV
jgi:hypothetical protein